MDVSDYWTSGRRRLLSRRSVLSGLALSAAAAAAAACGGRRTSGGQTGSQPGNATSAEGAPQFGGTYNYFHISNPPTLDVQRTTSYFAQEPVGATLSRLFRFKTGPDPKTIESYGLESDLAIGAESPDAVTWTIKLRPDAKFHNVPPVFGHAVEAEDVKASFTRALDPKNPNAGSLGMIDASQISTPDTQTVVFKLKYPYAPFTHILASPLYSWILPREALAGAYDPAKVVIGSGPFLFDSFTPDVAFTFKRNPEWFEKGRPYIDGVRYAIIPDSGQAQAQFKGGNLDEIGGAAGSVRANDVDTLRRTNPKATLLTNSPDQMYALVGQLGDPSSVWTDVRIRRAVSMMLDRNAISASVYAGQGRSQAAIPLSYGKWSLKPEDLPSNLAQNYKYDMAEAKKLLQAAGATDLTFKLLYTPNGYAQPYATLAETANSMLNAGGIKTNLVAIDYNSEYVNGGKGVRYGNFPKDSLVFGVATGGYTEIDEIIFAYYDSKSARRDTQLNDPQVDAMIDKARTLVNEDERVKAYLDIQRYLIDKMYFVTGWPGAPLYTMIQPWVHNYNHSTSYGFFTESFSKLWLKKS